MRGYLWASVVCCSVLAGGLPASGALYTVPLDGLRGVYSTAEPWQPTLDWGPLDKNISFDFGERFERIDGVRIQIRGTIAPSLWSIHSLFGAFPDHTTEIYPSLDLFVHAPGDYTTGGTAGGTAGVQVNGAFDAEWSFNLYFSTPDWGFLQNGRGDLYFGLTGLGFSTDVVATQIVPSVAGISEANLIVEGQIVPEPAGTSVLVLALLVIGLRRWRRK